MFFFFLLTELLRDMLQRTARPAGAEFHQNRADQFGFVSASPEVVVSMYSCHWTSAWSPLLQKPPLIFRPPSVLLSCTACGYLLSPLLHLSSSFLLLPSSTLCVWLWLTTTGMKGQRELTAPLTHLNLIKVNFTLSLACDSLHAALMSHSS